MTGSGILSRLFSGRISKPAFARRKYRSQSNHQVRSPRLEGLEKRQMLAVDMAPEVNIRFDQNVNANNGNTIVTITPVVGEDGIELTYDGVGDAVFVQCLFEPSRLPDGPGDTTPPDGGDAISFYTSPTLDVSSRLGWASHADLRNDLILEDSSLLDTVAGGEGSSVVRGYLYYNMNLSPGTNGYKTFRPSAQVDVKYVSKAELNSTTGQWSITTDEVTIWTFSDIDAGTTGAAEKCCFEFCRWW